MAPGRHVHPHPGECDLIWKRGLRRCNRTTDLEVRSSWIIPVGAESHDKCPYERERGEGGRDSEKAMEGRADCGDAAASQGLPAAARSGKREEGPSPGRPEIAALLTP